MKNKNRYSILNLKFIFLTILLLIFTNFLPGTVYAWHYAGGMLEDPDCTSVTGYAADPVDTNLSIDVTLYEGASAFDGGTFIATTTANIYREDANIAYGITGNHGFSFAIPEYLKDGVEHIIFAHAIDSGGAGPNDELSNSGYQSLYCVPAITTPTMEEVYIDPNAVTADGYSEYTIKVIGVDIGGFEKITEMYAMINRDGSNSGQHRGWLSWYKDDTYTGWDSLKDKMSCDGGGIAAIQDSFGDSYLRLVGCNSYAYSDTLRKTRFYVRFDPTFTSPILNNDISGYVKNTNSNTSGWVNQDINFRLEGYTPTDPIITGNDWAIVNLNNNYSFNSTDPDNYQIRYGVDWSIPSDEVADEWLPTTGYVNSGTTQNTDHSWNTTGDKSFKVLAQNEWGENSNWIKKELTVYDPDVQLVASPSSVTIGGNMEVSATFSGVPNPTTLDWIGIYAIGTDDYTFLDWIYTSSCTQTPSGSTPTDGVCGLVMPSVAGTYELRMFENDAWVKISTSNAVTVINSGPEATVTVTTNTVSGGKVVGPGIDCGFDCSENISLGTQITLTAVPSSSYWKFTGWSGGVCSGSGTCTFTVNSDRVINANFTLRSFIYTEQ